MVARVLLSSNAFKVSKPGFNVLTATRDELLISYEHRPAKIVVAGTVALAGSVVTVNFGRTLSALPIVYWQFGFADLSGGVVSRVPYWYVGAAVVYVDCRRFTNRVEFRPNADVRDFHYIVAEAI